MNYDFTYINDLILENVFEYGHNMFEYEHNLFEYGHNMFKNLFT